MEKFKAIDKRYVEEVDYDPAQIYDDQGRLLRWVP